MATRSEEALDRFIAESNDALAPLLHNLSPLERAMYLDDFASELRARVAVDVRSARMEGATWESIGGALGVTRSAVHQRFGGSSCTPSEKS